MPYNVKKIGVKQADGTYTLQDIGVDYSNVDGLDTDAVAFKAKKDLQGNDITGFFRDGSLSGSSLVLTRGSGTDPKSIAMGMQGATSGANGAAGLVPAPAIGDQIKFLRGDGTWQNSGGNLNDLGDVTISSPQNGQGLIYDSGTQKWGNGSFPSAPVSSVFGRTGAVTAQSGDYDASKITAGTFAGKTQANATAAATLTNAQLRDVTISITDLTPGTSSLAAGSIWIYYTP